MARKAWHGCLALLVGTLVACGGGGSSSSTPSGTPVTNPNLIGINLGSALDYDTNRIFTDAMKTSRAWEDTAWQAPLTNLDPSGWPLQDASICVWAGIANMQGTYALSFTGRANVSASWGQATLSGQSYDAGSNRTSLTLDYASTGSSALLLVFTNTQRTAASPVGSGLTDVVLMRPTTVGGSTPYTTEVFTAPFLAALADFTVLRTMDFSATNSNGAVDWTDRTTPGTASQAIGNPGAPAGGWQGRGGAWEYVVLLANQSGKDVWLNVPAGATDDYVTKLAQLTRYGSDGTNPYTAPQAAPVWPGLDPSRHLYVEFSNEVWNTAGAFQQSTTNHAAAVAEVGAGGSPLNYDGTTNDWFWAWRRTAKRILEISDLFRAVWGDAAMLTQVRPVLMSQLGYADGPLLQGLLLLEDYYGNPGFTATPHPPSHYLYGLGGSAYYNPSDFSSVEAIFTTMAGGFVPALQSDADYALALGLKRIAYEGGPSFDPTGVAAEDANLATAWADPRMTSVITGQHAAWSQNAGDLLVYFSLDGDYHWGFMADVLTPASPKMTGIQSLAGASRAAATYGTAIPGTLDGSVAHVPPAWAGGGSAMSQGSWFGYPVHVAAQGAFGIVLNVASGSPSAQADLEVDGASIGTVTLPGSGDATSLTTPSLGPGSHGLLVRCLAGSFTLSEVKVQAAP